MQCIFVKCISLQYFAESSILRHLPSSPHLLPLFVLVRIFVIQMLFNNRYISWNNCICTGKQEIIACFVVRLFKVVEENPTNSTALICRHKNYKKLVARPRVRMGGGRMPISSVKRWFAIFIQK